MLDGNPQCGVEVNCGSTLLENITFIFDPVWWNYPYKVFDNSIGTWATDYALAVFMVNRNAFFRLRGAGWKPILISSSEFGVHWRNRTACIII